MKFSVLLPTRNRLEYLKYAIETVRQQDYSNWEIIVSDNNSSENISGYIESIKENRIKYVRTETLIPVTDNWNNALQYSTGDYVVMLGDDDGLMPKYFSSILQAFKVCPSPDYVYAGGYFFAYPGAVQDEPTGYFRVDKNLHFIGDKPYWLEPKVARKIVAGYLDFKMPIASNMQFSLISKRLIQKLSMDGPFFRSPFPDFYATPLLFLESNATLIYPKPLVIVGITPKSYGTFHFASQSSSGTNFLQNEDVLKTASLTFPNLLPGTPYYDSWYLAMNELQKKCKARLYIHLNLRRYRFLQIIHVYKGHYFNRQLSKAEIYKLNSKMTLVEKLVYGMSLPTFFLLLRLIPGGIRGQVVALLRRMLGQHAIQVDSNHPHSEYSNLLDVYESMDHYKNSRGIE